MPATIFNNPMFAGAKVITVSTTVTNTSGTYSYTFTDNRIVTGMKPMGMEITDPAVFNGKITVTANNGSYTVACPDVAGETTIKIYFMKVADEPNNITSREYDALSAVMLVKGEQTLTAAEQEQVIDNLG